MPENTLPVEPGTSYDTLKTLVQQAQQGDTTTLPLIRTLLDQVPALWNDSHVLAHQVERSWTNALSGQDLMSKEIITREVQGLRSQLLGSHPTPLEKLLGASLIATKTNTLKKKKDQLSLAQYGDKLPRQARSRRPRGAGG